jgi:hypothetical protein
MSLLPICGKICEKTEIFFRSKELMDKAILLESEVKPEERASVQKIDILSSLH